MSNAILIADAVRFFSAGDEKVFFDWLREMPDVGAVSGRGSQILIQLKTDIPQEESLRELLALFHRFKIDSSQLAKFVTEENKTWFVVESAYWFQSVFGDANQEATVEKDN